MKAYPMNGDNCKAHVICSLHHCSHDLMWYDNLCKSIHHAPKKYYKWNKLHDYLLIYKNKRIKLPHLYINLLLFSLGWPHKQHVLLVLYSQIWTRLTDLLIKKSLNSFAGPPLIIKLTIVLCLVGIFALRF